MNRETAAAFGRDRGAFRPHHKFNTKTVDTVPMESECMADRRDRNRAGPRAASHGLLAAALRLAAAGGLAVSLGACASGASSSLFVDPATYSLYSCQQLGVARRTTNDRVVELEGLMAKAESGAAGSLVSGLAYQTDYRATRARRDQIDEKIVSNNCTSADLAPPAGTEPQVPSSAPTKRRR